MAVANEGIYEDGKTIPITCANLVSILEDIALEQLFVKRSPPRRLFCLIVHSCSRRARSFWTS